MAILNFDSTNVPVATALDPVPTDWYPCIMTESDIKPTSNNTGAYLECVYEIIDGQYKGRKLWDRLNLQNANQTAVEIAYKTLSAICHATGVIQVADSSQLHNRPLMVKAVLVPAQEEKDAAGNVVKRYEAKNDVKGYKAMEAAQPATNAPPTFASPPATTAAPPWATAAPATTAAPPWASAAGTPTAASAAGTPTAPPWASAAAGAPAAPPWAAK